MSCGANDYRFDAVFSRFIESLAQRSNVLLAISTSGNSQNILTTVTAAHEKGMKIVTLTGNDGSELSRVADIEINIPHFGYSDRIQEMHVTPHHSRAHCSV